jgi:hypothetical protein
MHTLLNRARHAVGSDSLHQLAQDLIRAGYGIPRDARNAIIEEFETALVYFFVWVNLLDHTKEGPADNCGTWTFFRVQAALGRDDFINPFLEEAGRIRYLINNDHTPHPDIPDARIRGTYECEIKPHHWSLNRARHWRKWWACLNMRYYERDIYEMLCVEPNE